MTLPPSAEVVVVGGGSTGTSIAYHLARRGVDVLLLERHGIASGPTGRSTAIVRQHYSQRLLVEMAVHGLRVYSRFAEEVGGSSGFVRSGVLWAVGEADRKGLESNVALAQDAGAELELVEVRDAASIDPRIATDGLAGFCWEPTAGHCDPYLAAAGYAAAAEALGARVETGVEVCRLGGEAVETGGGSVSADAVVVAVGPWSAPLLRPLGYELPIRPARAEVGRFRVPTGFGQPPPALADFSPLQFYVKPAEDGYLEVGTLDPAHADHPIDPDRSPEGAERETLATFEACLRRRLPGVAGGHWRGAWSGVYDVTPDWQPAIGAVPGTERTLVAAGFSGHGFKLAPATGVAVSELICDGASATFDVAPLAPDRFERGALVASRYGYSVIG